MRGKNEAKRSFYGKFDFNPEPLYKRKKFCNYGRLNKTSQQMQKIQMLFVATFLLVSLLVTSGSGRVSHNRFRATYNMRTRPFNNRNIASRRLASGAMVIRMRPGRLSSSSSGISSRITSRGRGAMGRRFQRIWSSAKRIWYLYWIVPLDLMSWALLWIHDVIESKQGTKKISKLSQLVTRVNYVVLRTHVSSNNLHMLYGNLIKGHLENLT